MKNESLFFVLCILVSLGCGNDSDEPKIDGNFLWHTPFPTNVLAATMNPVLFGDLVIFSNDFILGDDLLIAYDNQTGEEEWIINNDDLPGYDSNTKSFVDNGKLYLFQDGSLACIDLNGNLEWHHQITDVGGWKGIPFYKDELYLYGETGVSSAIFKIDRSDGLSTKLLEYTHSDFTTKVRYMHFFEADGDEYLVSRIGYASTDFQTVYDSLFIYNLADLQLVSKRPPLEGGNSYGSKFNDQSMLTSNQDYYFKVNLLTDSVEWKVSKDGFSLAKFEIHGDGVYYAENSSPTNFAERIRKLSLLDGSEQWIIPFGHIVDRMYLSNSNLYLTKLRGKLAIIDTDSGAQKEELVSPDYKSNSNAFFDDALLIDPITNDVFCGNYISALKFQGIE